MANSRGELPAWVDIGLIQLLKLFIALLVAGLVVLIIGENPFEAMWIMLKGAVGSIKGWGYVLYYATNFIFTGLAVAVAFHAGLFNIGGEGQAYFAPHRPLGTVSDPAESQLHLHQYSSYRLCRRYSEIPNRDAHGCA